MSYELIISEKPQAAQKIALALADKNVEKKRDRVNYFKIKHNGRDIIVASAVGHLYGLGEKGGESWTYPVFNTEWKAIYKINKSADYTKDYIKKLEDLGKKASEITIACDFDVEGEVIGLNVMRFALHKKDANRMKFSTLTKNDLISAYKSKQNHLEWGQARAGEARHILDWFYGINLSRALTQAVKKGANRFKVLSTGRVQGPALHFLAEREKKIIAFKPQNFSEIYLKGDCHKIPIEAQYELPKEKSEQILEENENGEEQKIIDKHKIFDLKWAEKIVYETSNKNGRIEQIESKNFKQKVPTPFDLTSLQMEASTMLGFSPKRTLELAQKLYIEGITSYPRTSSQKIPKEVNPREILQKLSKQNVYKSKVDLVFKVNPSIKPNEGKKDDPAHPSIMPTGEIPKKLEPQERKLYDLIVKRFLAVFGKDAIRQTNTISILIEKHKFILKGTRTIEKNWHELYEPYLKFEEVQLPELEKGEIVINKNIRKDDKKTSPPKRYTDASIIKELEKRNLGTKATRAEILSNLKDRGYIIDKSIKVTELGLQMDEVLSSEIPKLVDEELTRQFEEEMEAIRSKHSNPDKVLDLAKIELEKILSDIQKNEIKLGQKLAEASKLAMIHQASLSPCPICKKGTLMLKHSNKTKKKFAACNQYPNCKTIFNLPQMPFIKSLEEDAVDENGKIYVLAGRSEGNLRKICINEESAKEEERELGHKKYDEEEMVCPVCKKGVMKLRKSFYGEFLGCSNYPKCKTMMKIHNGKVDVENPITSNGKDNKSKSVKGKSSKDNSKTN
jgi:DNA topoisomerase-1